MGLASYGQIFNAFGEENRPKGTASIYNFHLSCIVLLIFPAWRDL